MRQITKDIQITIDGSPQSFRLTKPDAFSGVEILRLLLRLQDQWDGGTRGRFSQLHERETREPSPAFQKVRQEWSAAITAVFPSLPPAGFSLRMANLCGI